MPVPPMDQAGVAALAAALADPARLAFYRSKVVTVPGNDCLWWTGAVAGRSRREAQSGGGHGRFWFAPGRVIIAHRFAYVGGRMSESPEMVRAGIYWLREVQDLARSAYVADLDATPAGPEFFVDWLRRALEAHAALKPKARARRAADLPELGGGPGFNQMYPLPSELLEQVEQAIVEDRKELGRVASRSAFAREAVLVAVEAARRRRGGTLPPPPNQLPNRRPRRHP